MKDVHMYNSIQVWILTTDISGALDMNEIPLVPLQNSVNSWNSVDVAMDIPPCSLLLFFW